MLFIGNNRYALAPGRLGQREALDAGTLSVFAVAQRSRLALVGFALRTLIGRADPVLDFAAMGECAHVRVDARSHGVSGRAGRRGDDAEAADRFHGSRGARWRSSCRLRAARQPPKSR